MQWQMVATVSYACSKLLFQIRYCISKAEITRHPVEEN